MRLKINYRGISIFQKDTYLESDKSQKGLAQQYVSFFVNKALSTTTLLI